MKACASAKLSIQRQRVLAFGNALGRAVRIIWTTPRNMWAQRVLRGQGQSLDQGRLGRREARGPIVGEEG